MRVEGEREMKESIWKLLAQDDSVQEKQEGTGVLRHFEKALKRVT